MHALRAVVQRVTSPTPLCGIMRCSVGSGSTRRGYIPNTTRHSCSFATHKFTLMMSNTSLLEPSPTPALLTMAYSSCPLRLAAAACIPHCWRHTHIHTHARTHTYTHTRTRTRTRTHTHIHVAKYAFTAGALCVSNAVCWNCTTQPVLRVCVGLQLAWS